MRGQQRFCVACATAATCLVSEERRATHPLPLSAPHRSFSSSEQGGEKFRHVGARSPRFLDLKHDPDSDWQPKDDESDYEYPVYADEHEHVSTATWLKWLLTTLLQVLGALALVGGAASTLVSHALAKSQALEDATAVLAGAQRDAEEAAMFLDTITELAALVEEALGDSPDAWGAGPEADQESGEAAMASATLRSSEWIRRRAELATLRLDKVGPMVRELALLQEAGQGTLAPLLATPALLPRMVLLAQGEEDVYTATYQCEVSGRRLAEQRADVGSWIEGMSVEGLPGMLAAAQQRAAARRLAERA